jgi:hypothetical protein
MQNKFSSPFRKYFQIKLLVKVLSFLILQTFSLHALAHGFNADKVKIIRMPNGMYRLTIQYTHLQIGERREAHIELNTEKQATETFQKLTQGADFFLGQLDKNIHFHNPPETKKPW